MAVPILQVLVGLIVALSGLAMAGKTPTTKKEQWAYRAIFLFLGVVLLALAWMQCLNLTHLRTLAMQNLAVSNTPQTRLVPKQTDEMAPVAAAQTPAPAPAAEPAAAAVPAAGSSALQQKYATLLRNLSRDPSIPADVRERIIIATATLGKEAEAAQQPANSEALIAAESAKAKILPIFDAAIKSLAALSDKAAAQKGDKSILDYQGLPEDLKTEGRDEKRSRKSAAEIKFQSNPAWDFQIYFAETVTPNYQASLSVSGKGGVLVLKSAGDSIETRVEVLSGESSEHKPAKGDEAKANIDDALKKLIAAESEAMDVTR